VDAVGFEVSCVTSVVACPLVVPGGICIACRLLSFSGSFGGMIVQFAVCALVLLEYVSLSRASMSATSSATATATISAKGVEGRCGGCNPDFVRYGRSLGTFADPNHTLLACGSGDSLFKDLDGGFI